MQPEQPRCFGNIRRAVAAVVLLTGAFGAPAVASAQSFSPASAYSSYYGSTTVYQLDQTTSTVAFGDGVYGQQLPYGASTGVSYSTGSGAAGNVPDAWPTDTINCLFVNC